MKSRDVIWTEKYGFVQRRRDYEPAFLHCEKCRTMTRHAFVEDRLYRPGHCKARASTEDEGKPITSLCRHPVYVCACGNERIWG